MPSPLYKHTAESIYQSTKFPFCIKLTFLKLILYFSFMAQMQARYDPHHDPQQKQHPQQQQQQLTRKVAKTTTAVTLGGSLMVLSGLTLAATVIGLVLATPLLVIFSPVLVPAAITIFLILAGFITSGGFGATASFVFYWMYRYATGKHPAGSEHLDRAREGVRHVAQDVKERAEHMGQQVVGR